LSFRSAFCPVRTISNKVNPAVSTQIFLTAPRTAQAGATNVSSETEQARSSKVQACLAVIFRALGIDVLSTLLAYIGLFRDGPEPPKRALDQNRWTAAARSLVHLLPFSATIVVLYLNFASYYVGAVFEQTGALQFAAKVHELLMISSLMAILTDVIRREVLGEGVPFGILFAPLQLSNLQYLWSLEFWGAIVSKDIPWRRRTRLVLLVLPIFILAATVGPSSAVAMIPRRGNIPSGRIRLWYDYTLDELFPANLPDMEHPWIRCNWGKIEGIPMKCKNYEAQESYRSLLKSSDIQLGRYSLQAGKYYKASEMQVPLVATNISAGIIPDSASSVRSMYSSWDDFPFRLEGTTAVTTQSKHLSGALIFGAITYQTHLAYANLTERQDMTISAHGLQPYVSTMCDYDYKISREELLRNYPNGHVPITFKTIKNDRVIISVPTRIFKNLTRPDVKIEVTPGVFLTSSEALHDMYFLDVTDKDEYSVTSWVLLWIGFSDNWPVVVPCTIYAAWVDTPMSLTTTSSATDLSFIRNHEIDEPSQLDPFRGGAPFQRLNVSAAWANEMNPWLPEKNCSAIQLVMSDRSFAERSFLLGEGSTRSTSYAVAVSRLYVLSLAGWGQFAFGRDFYDAPSSTLYNLTDGGCLWDRTRVPTNGSRSSRCDASQIRPWVLKDYEVGSTNPFNKTDSYYVTVQATRVGMSYGQTTPTIILALVVLVAYCALVVGYVVFSISHGLSSSSWEHLSEVVALTWNSHPSRMLKNACTGIRNIRVFRRMVHIRVTRSTHLYYQGIGHDETKLKDMSNRRTSSEDDMDHLELQFSEDGQSGEAVQPNVEYGFP
jgi:hypothetical protein